MDDQFEELGSTLYIFFKSKFRVDYKGAGLGPWIVGKSTKPLKIRKGAWLGPVIVRRHIFAEYSTGSKARTQLAVFR